LRAQLGRLSLLIAQADQQTQLLREYLPTEPSSRLPKPGNQGFCHFLSSLARSVGLLDSARDRYVVDDLPVQNTHDSASELGRLGIVSDHHHSMPSMVEVA